MGGCFALFFSCVSALGRQKERKREKRDKKNMVKEGKNDDPAKQKSPLPRLHGTRKQTGHSDINRITNKLPDSSRKKRQILADMQGAKIFGHLANTAEESR